MADVPAAASDQPDELASIQPHVSPQQVSPQVAASTSRRFSLKRFSIESAFNFNSPQRTPDPLFMRKTKHSRWRRAMRRRMGSLGANAALAGSRRASVPTPGAAVHAASKQGFEPKKQTSLLNSGIR